MTELSWRSALLGAGALQGIVVALLLWLGRENRVANRCLAGLLLTVSLSQVPQILGFSGFYDAYPWLTFAPFDLSLLYAPLLYLYPYRLLHGRMPGWWGWLLLPGGLQLAYYSTVFLSLDVEAKWALSAGFHGRIVHPLETVLVLLGLCLALGLSIRRFFAYQRWVPDQVSDRENFRLRWLRTFLAGMSLSVLLAVGFEMVDAFVQPLGYRQVFPFYLWLALLTYYLGIEGYRNAGVVYPEMPAAAPALRDREGSQEAAPEAGDSRDWAAVAAPWISRVEAERLFLNPGLTLTSLARALGTNPGTLSRAINHGTGQSFNDLINGYRVTEVQRRLREGDSGEGLLEVALASGFNSKTAFNRSFKAATGMTPSAWRAAHAGSPETGSGRSDS